MTAALLAWSSLHAADSATKLNADESITLFPGLSWRDPAGAGWLIEFHGWVYEQEPRRVTVAVLQKLLGLRLEDLNAEEQRYFKERSRWFLVDNERAKNLVVRLGGMTFDLGETESDGHVKKTIAITEAANHETGLKEGTNIMTLKLAENDMREIQGAVHLVGEEGWTVVSDIDDTIKVTEVRNKDALVRNTFCRAFQPAEGMAKVYTEWAGEGAVFHYVSASPWQLYPDLQAFRITHGYPAGTFHLRNIRLKDQSGVDFLIGSAGFKPNEIGSLLARFPKRRFVLVGDSGEHDPEIYGELARNHPKQVVRVLIRDVTKESAGVDRYRAAFQGIAPEKWAIFKHPEEVKQLGPVK